MKIRANDIISGKTADNMPYALIGSDNTNRKRCHCVVPRVHWTGKNVWKSLDMPCNGANKKHVLRGIYIILLQQ